MRGVFLDTATVDRQDLDLTSLTASLPDWSLRRHTPASDVVGAIRDAAVVVSNKVMLDREVLQATASLKLVCVAATGTNNVDMDAARDQGITVCNARGYATTSVVEHVFSVMLAFYRQSVLYQQAVREGRWHSADVFCLHDYPIHELAGQTLGIIGHGELGSAVANMARAFGMEILVAQRPGGATRAGRVPMHALLSQADVVSLHCPLTDATRNLIGRDELDSMKNSALLINTARGGIVNETALLDALQTGQIAGAAIDVLTNEPPRAGNPLLDEPVPNLIVTPHIAWASTRARQSLIDQIAGNVLAFLDGKPRNVVVNNS
jgi:glycerate dehydrogenase